MNSPGRKRSTGVRHESEPNPLDSELSSQSGDFDSGPALLRHTSLLDAQNAKPTWSPQVARSGSVTSFSSTSDASFPSELTLADARRLSQDALNDDGKRDEAAGGRARLSSSSWEVADVHPSSTASVACPAMSFEDAREQARRGQRRGEPDEATRRGSAENSALPMRPSPVESAEGEAQALSAGALEAGLLERKDDGNGMPAASTPPRQVTAVHRVKMDVPWQPPADSPSSQAGGRFPSPTAAHEAHPLETLKSSRSSTNAFESLLHSDTASTQASSLTSSSASAGAWPDALSKEGRPDTAPSSITAGQVESDLRQPSCGVGRGSVASGFPLPSPSSPLPASSPSPPRPGVRPSPVEEAQGAGASPVSRTARAEAERRRRLRRQQETRAMLLNSLKFTTSLRADPSCEWSSRLNEERGVAPMASSQTLQVCEGSGAACGGESRPPSYNATRGGGSAAAAFAADTQGSGVSRGSGGDQSRTDGRDRAGVGTLQRSASRLPPHPKSPVTGSRRLPSVRFLLQALLRAKRAPAAGPGGSGPAAATAAGDSRAVQGMSPYHGSASSWPTPGSAGGSDCESEAWAAPTGGWSRLGMPWRHSLGSAARQSLAHPDRDSGDTAGESSRLLLEFDDEVATPASTLTVRKPTNTPSWQAALCYSTRQYTSLDVANLCFYTKMTALFEAHWATIHPLECVVRTAPDEKFPLLSWRRGRRRWHAERRRTEEGSANVPAGKGQQGRGGRDGLATERGRRGLQPQEEDEADPKMSKSGPDLVPFVSLSYMIPCFMLRAFRKLLINRTLLKEMMAEFKSSTRRTGELRRASLLDESKPNDTGFGSRPVHARAGAADPLISLSAAPGVSSPRRPGDDGDSGTNVHMDEAGDSTAGTHAAVSISVSTAEASQASWSAEYEEGNKASFGQAQLPRCSTPSVSLPTPPSGRGSPCPSSPYGSPVFVASPLPASPSNRLPNPLNLRLRGGRLFAPSADVHSPSAQVPFSSPAAAPDCASSPQTHRPSSPSVHFTSASSAQPPVSSTASSPHQVLHLYLCCGGKDMLALDWLPFISRFLHYSLSVKVKNLHSRAADAAAAAAAVAAAFSARAATLDRDAALAGAAAAAAAAATAADEEIDRSSSESDALSRTETDSEGAAEAAQAAETGDSRNDAMCGLEAARAAPEKARNLPADGERPAVAGAGARTSRSDETQGGERDDGRGPPALPEKHRRHSVFAPAAAAAAAAEKRWRSLLVAGEATPWGDSERRRRSLLAPFDAQQTTGGRLPGRTASVPCLAGTERMRTGQREDTRPVYAPHRRRASQCTAEEFAGLAAAAVRSIQEKEAETSARENGFESRLLSHSSFPAARHPVAIQGGQAGEGVAPVRRRGPTPSSFPSSSPHQEPPTSRVANEDEGKPGVARFVPGGPPQGHLSPPRLASSGERKGEQAPRHAAKAPGPGVAGSCPAPREPPSPSSLPRSSSSSSRNRHFFWSCPSAPASSAAPPVSSRSGGHPAPSLVPSLPWWTIKEVEVPILIYMNAAFVLIDYPGYGGSTGSPTPAGCVAAALRSLNVAIFHLKKQRGEDVKIQISVLGYSLGCAVALRTAQVICRQLLRRDEDARRRERRARRAGKERRKCHSGETDKRADVADAEPEGKGNQAPTHGAAGEQGEIPETGAKCGRGCERSASKQRAAQLGRRPAQDDAQVPVCSPLFAGHRREATAGPIQHELPVDHTAAHPATLASTSLLRQAPVPVETRSCPSTSAPSPPSSAGVSTSTGLLFAGPTPLSTAGAGASCSRGTALAQEVEGARCPVGGASLGFVGLPRQGDEDAPPQPLVGPSSRSVSPLGASSTPSANRSRLEAGPRADAAERGASAGGGRVEAAGSKGESSTVRASPLRRLQEFLRHRQKKAGQEDGNDTERGGRPQTAAKEGYRENEGEIAMTSSDCGRMHNDGLGSPRPSVSPLIRQCLSGSTDGAHASASERREGTEEDSREATADSLDTRLPGGNGESHRRESLHIAAPRSDCEQDSSLSCGSSARAAHRSLAPAAPASGSAPSSDCLDVLSEGGTEWGRNSGGELAAEGRDSFTHASEAAVECRRHLSEDGETAIHHEEDARPCRPGSDDSSGVFADAAERGTGEATAGLLSELPSYRDDGSSPSSTSRPLFKQSPCGPNRNPTITLRTLFPSTSNSSPALASTSTSSSLSSCLAERHRMTRALSVPAVPDGSEIIAAVRAQLVHPAGTTEKSSGPARVSAARSRSRSTGLAHSLLPHRLRYSSANAWNSPMSALSPSRASFASAVCAVSGVSAVSSALSAARAGGRLTARARTLTSLDELPSLRTVVSHYLDGRARRGGNAGAAVPPAIDEERGENKGPVDEHEERTRRAQGESTEHVHASSCGAFASPLEATPMRRYREGQPVAPASRGAPTPPEAVTLRCAQERPSATRGAESLAADRHDAGGITAEEADESEGRETPHAQVKSVSSEMQLAGSEASSPLSGPFSWCDRASHDNGSSGSGGRKLASDPSSPVSSLGHIAHDSPFPSSSWAPEGNGEESAAFVSSGSSCYSSDDSSCYSSDDSSDEDDTFSEFSSSTLDEAYCLPTAFAEFRCLVLVAPFTSTADCAAHYLNLPWGMHGMVEAFISYIQDECTRWDNVACMRSLCRIFDANPKLFAGVGLYIFHGRDDRIVPLAMGQALAETALNCSSCVHSHSAVQARAEGGARDGPQAGVHEDGRRNSQDEREDEKRKPNTCRGEQVDHVLSDPSGANTPRGTRPRERPSSASSYSSTSSTDVSSVSMFAAGHRPPTPVSSLLGPGDTSRRRRDVHVIETEKDLLDVLNLSDQRRKAATIGDGQTGAATRETEDRRGRRPWRPSRGEYGEHRGETASEHEEAAARGGSLASAGVSPQWSEEVMGSCGDGVGSSDSKSENVQEEEGKRRPVLRLPSIPYSESPTGSSSSRDGDKGAHKGGCPSPFQESRGPQSGRSAASSRHFTPAGVTDTSSPAVGREGEGRDDAGERDEDGARQRSREEDADDAVPQEFSPTHARTHLVAVTSLSPTFYGTRRPMDAASSRQTKDAQEPSPTRPPAGAPLHRSPVDVLSEDAIPARPGGEARAMQDRSEARRRASKIDRDRKRDEKKGNYTRNSQRASSSWLHPEGPGRRSCVGVGDSGRRESAQTFCPLCALGPHAELIDVGNADHRTICSSPAHQKKIFAALYDDDVVHVIC
ncbi:hypothetical protein NCLIV_046490 [Neospora caninum Liverpool]|uniref:Uncharacterized protein n=1 Tax=Neospora caninum (strain Liverpool) TaxID=572307 RepID=F0VLT9_NEOCL|nr:hypothetical protein NCLIV_046490 [Neospora caninum Liverpool]CBZ54217.1 hypothetical protein NCLIV_046490 [Neospora caninum Liverpool]CEL68918.1 TPA: hypothetical protein BN1204_046490 [Neospora caninum Liverpool]|eukprot:XP_003884248.1 hypothetical protein NCLIV_046490 [Neospora caninum Liverpool]